MTAVANPVGGSGEGDIVVAARALQRRHRGGRGVGPLDIEVRRGERLAIMGPNGAGKTTLLRLVATLDRPTSGALAWWGSTSSLVARRGLGVAPDDATEEETLSAEQSTYFWCRQWIGDAGQARRLTEIALERFGLHDVADEPIAVFSSGMRRRLAIATALAHEPALGLLDEPTAGLDPAGVATLRDELWRRSRVGMTTVMASNDPGFVESACDRVAFLADGRLVCVAAPAELLRSSRSARVVHLGLDGAGEAVSAIAALAGVEQVEAAEGGLHVRFRGESVLPRIVAVADDPAGRLRALRVREPDLRDCFRALAGQALEVET
jgi:ABC-2 type transport system ATP-binding protein